MWIYRLVLLALLVIQFIGLVANSQYIPVVYKHVRLPNVVYKFIDRDHDYIDDQLELCRSRYVYAIVILNTKPSYRHLAVIEELGGRIVSSLWSRALYGFTVYIDSSKIKFLRDRLLAIDSNGDGYSDLLFIEARRSYEFMMHYASRQIGVYPLVWRLGFDGSYSSVGLIDSGVDRDAPGLEGVVIAGFDATGTGVDPYRDNVGHGTSLAYAIAGVYNGSRLVLSSGLLSPFPSTGGTGFNYSIDYVSKPPITVYRREGLLRVMVWVYPYVSTRDYMAWVFKGIGYADFYQLSLDNLTLVSYNDTWSYIGYGVAYTVLEIDTSVYGSGNYFIGIQHNYHGEVYVWFEAITYSSSNGETLSCGVAIGSKIVSLKIIDKYGSVYTDYIVEAIEKAIEYRDVYNISVLNIGVGGPYSLALEIATRNAVENGLLVVAPAGNNGVSKPGAGDTYPSAYPWVVSVGAVNGFNNLTSYTSIGGYSSYDNKTIKPDILAPGGGYVNPIYSSDSNDEYDFINVSGYFDPDNSDLDYCMGTSIASAIVSGVASIVVSILRSIKYNKTASLWDKLLEDNASQAVNLVKYILYTSCYETYPLSREYNGTDLSMYSPTLDRGFKDSYEGYGVLDGYNAVLYTLSVADYILVNWYGEIVTRDYVLEGSIRNGVLYNTHPPYAYNKPFNASVYSIPYIFNNNYLRLNNTVYKPMYTIKLVVSSKDLGRTDADILIYYYNFSSEPVLLNSSTRGFGARYEVLRITTLDNVSLYTIVVRRAREDSSGFNFKVRISPFIDLNHTSNGLLKIYSYSIVGEAEYAILILYHVAGNKTIIDKYWVLETIGYNGLRTIGLTINISGLDSSVEWELAVVYTDRPCSPYNLSREYIVDGPIVEAIDIPGIVSIELQAPHKAIVSRNYTIDVAIKDYMGYPVANRSVMLYHSIDHHYWRLLAINHTGLDGETAFNIVVNRSGLNYYLVLVGNSSREYGGLREFVIEAYTPTSIVIDIDRNTTYTVEPVSITITLYNNLTKKPLYSEKVGLYARRENGSWVLVGSGYTSLNGSWSINALFMESGVYVLKAVYNGSDKDYLLPTESMELLLVVYKTPTGLSIDYSYSSLRVYDELAIITRLSYRTNTSRGYIAYALVELWMSNGSRWYVVSVENTSRHGYAVFHYVFQRNGSYVFKAVYHGNESFEPVNSSEVRVSVRSRNTFVEVTSYPENAYLGQIIVVRVRLLDEDGEYIVGERLYLLELLNGSWSIVSTAKTGAKGYAVFLLRVPSSGLHRYMVYYPGRDYVYNKSYSIEFTINVSWIAFAVVVTPSKTECFVGEPVDFLVQVIYNSSLVPYAPLKLYVYRGDRLVRVYDVVTGSKGYIVYTVLFNYSGDYIVYACYTGSINTSNRYSNNVSITVEPIPLRIEVHVYGDTVATREYYIVVTVYNVLNNSLVDGLIVLIYKREYRGKWGFYTMGLTNTNGSIRVGVVDKYSGLYQYRIVVIDPWSYRGLQRYKTTVYIINVTVYRVETRVVVKPASYTGYVGERVCLSIYLETVYGEPLVNATVTLQEFINGKWVSIETRYTDSYGYTVFCIESSSYGSRTYRVVYNGSRAYDACIVDNISIVFNRIPTALEVVDMYPVKPVVGEYIVFKTRLYCFKGVLAGEVVEARIYSSNSLYDVCYSVTGVDGIALFSLSILKPGSYQVVFTFNGDDTYRGSSVSRRLTIYPNITLLLDIECRVLDNGSIEYLLEARLIVSNKSMYRGRVLFYIVEPDSPVYIGECSLVNGVALYRYVSSNYKKYLFKAVYEYRGYTVESIGEAKCSCIPLQLLPAHKNRYLLYYSMITVMLVLVITLTIARRV